LILTVEISVLYVFLYTSSTNNEPISHHKLTAYRTQNGAVVTAM